MADTQRTLICPACGKEMEKVFIHNRGINVDICTQGCGGIYFDNRELKEFDEQFEDIDTILKKVEGKTFIKTDESQVRQCPNCGSNMVKNPSSINSEVEIDECYFCGGKFLDNGELQKLREEFVTEKDKSDATVEYLYKVVGASLKEADLNYLKAQTNRSPLQRLFLKIMGVK